MNYCQCGMPLRESSSMNTYTIVIYNSKGDIVFAVCEHGNVVIDRRGEDIIGGQNVRTLLTNNYLDSRSN